MLTEPEGTRRFNGLTLQKVSKPGEGGAPGTPPENVLLKRPLQTCFGSTRWATIRRPKLVGVATLASSLLSASSSIILNTSGGEQSAGRLTTYSFASLAKNNSLR